MPRQGESTTADVVDTFEAIPGDPAIGAERGRSVATGASQATPGTTVRTMTGEKVEGFPPSAVAV